MSGKDVFFHQTMLAQFVFACQPNTHDTDPRLQQYDWSKLTFEVQICVNFLSLHICLERSRGRRPGGDLTFVENPTTPVSFHRRGLTFVVGQQVEEGLAHFLPGQRLDVLQVVQQGPDGVVLSLPVHRPDPVPVGQLPLP